MDTVRLFLMSLTPFHGLQQNIVDELFFGCPICFSSVFAFRRLLSAGTMACAVSNGLKMLLSSVE